MGFQPVLGWASSLSSKVGPVRLNNLVFPHFGSKFQIREKKKFSVILGAAFFLVLVTQTSWLNKYLKVITFPWVPLNPQPSKNGVSCKPFRTEAARLVSSTGSFPPPPLSQDQAAVVQKVMGSIGFSVYPKGFMVRNRGKTRL